jgi:pimeloyl-ACP methyl ester carboxylesterase
MEVRFDGLRNGLEHQRLNRAELQIQGGWPQSGAVNVWVRLILMLVAGGAALVLLAAWIMARAFVRPPRMTDGKAAWVLKRLSPGDLGLGFTPITFQVRDEHSGKLIRLAAWWIGAQGAMGRCVVLIHGYADAKVGAIAWAPLFHELGWNILAVDLRAHGESEGDCTTAGFFERYDLNLVLDQLEAEMLGQMSTLVLFGASMGAATALGTTALREDVAGVILDSPFADFRHACFSHAELLGAPGGVVRKLALHMAEWMTGADFEALRATDLIEQVHCPILVIQSGIDPYITSDDSAALEQVIGKREDGSACWMVSTAPHLMALREEPNEYKRRITEFLANVVKNTQS